MNTRQLIEDTDKDELFDLPEEYWVVARGSDHTKYLRHQRERGLFHWDWQPDHASRFDHSQALELLAWLNRDARSDYLYTYGIERASAGLEIA